VILLSVGAIATTIAWSSLLPANLGITRMQGSPYYITDAGIRNQYMIRLTNKKSGPASLRVTARCADGVTPVSIAGFEDLVPLQPMEETVRALVVSVEKKNYRGPFPIVIRMEEAGGAFSIEEKVEFLGPNPILIGASQP